MQSVIMPPEAARPATDAALALLTVLAKPDAAKALINTITAARDEANSAAAALGDLQAKDAAITKRADEIEAAGAAERERLQVAQAALNRERAAHDATVSRHEFAAAKLERDRAELEASKRAHAERLAEFDKFKRAAIG